MVFRVRPKPKIPSVVGGKQPIVRGGLGKSIPSVTATSSTQELRKALNQARKAVADADTPQQRKEAQANYIKILRMQPTKLPEGQGGVSPRILSTKEQVATGKIKPSRDKPIPPGQRLRRNQVSDVGENISDYMSRKYPSNKKYGGKITYKMTGGQVVDSGYD